MKKNKLGRDRRMRGSELLQPYENRKMPMMTPDLSYKDFFIDRGIPQVVVAKAVGRSISQTSNLLLGVSGTTATVMAKLAMFATKIENKNRGDH